jgi:hypothetical protein
VNYIIHFLECYEAWKVNLQWVTTHSLEHSDLEFERMLSFKELHCGYFAGFISEKKGRFLDIISEAKLFLLDRSDFILFKKILKNISQFIYLKNISNRFSKSNICSCR